MKCSRRQVLVGFFGLAAGSSAWVGWQWRKSTSVSTKTADPLFKPAQQKTLLAALERVFPGSVEAGVPDYLAYWLTQDGFFKGLRAQLEMGLILLDRVALRTHRKIFSNCSALQQDELLRQFQKGAVNQGQFHSAQFFERLVTLTLEGYFSDPKYGGNRNQVGWKLVGYKPCWWAPRSVPKHL